MVDDFRVLIMGDADDAAAAAAVLGQHRMRWLAYLLGHVEKVGWECKMACGLAEARMGSLRASATLKVAKTQGLPRLAGLPTEMPAELAGRVPDKAGPDS